MEFGEKLRTLRREKGLSQEELAAMVGVSRQALSKWEAGQSRPELDKLLALSDVFSVTMDSLVRPGGPEPQPDPPASPSLGWWYHGPVIEYKSARTLRGLPLVHINLGPGKRRARGVLAVGNVATGLVSVGFVARGGLSLGILSLGVLSIGPLAVGLLAGRRPHAGGSVRWRGGRSACSPSVGWPSGCSPSAAAPWPPMSRSGTWRGAMWLSAGMSAAPSPWRIPPSPAAAP